METFLKFLCAIPLPVWGGGLLFTEPFNPDVEPFDVYCNRLHLARLWRWEVPPQTNTFAWDWWDRLKTKEVVLV